MIAMNITLNFVCANGNCNANYNLKWILEGMLIDWAIRIFTFAYQRLDWWPLFKHLPWNKHFNQWPRGKHEQILFYFFRLNFKMFCRHLTFSQLLSLHFCLVWKQFFPLQYSLTVMILCRKITRKTRWPFVRAYIFIANFKDFL